MLPIKTCISNIHAYINTFSTFFWLSPDDPVVLKIWVFLHLNWYEFGTIEDFIRDRFSRDKSLLQPLTGFNSKASIFKHFKKAFVKMHFLGKYGGNNFFLSENGGKTLQKF